ncbi:hypothetical protein H4R21_000131 [Coemansia helicoidea]|uniref:Uncharacterized protein n=1 Tax=Coemansia helicoidea TaxID=1286919 RepID=A0ACC1LI39_9FUNG|nr:hypothetical protein H4R21_000131 [Coemansia helicoidea]
MPSPDGGAKRPLHQRVAERLFADPPKEHGARAAAAGMGARKIYVNCDVPEAELAGHAAHYCTNAITTAQYTLLTFLPVNLARQFRRVANIYFLVLTILQLIPYFAVGSAFLTVAPILLVLAITAAKDAFEDWRRHITDRHFNETPTRLVRNLRNANLLWQDTLSQAATTNALLSLRIRFARQLKRRTRHNQVPHHWEEAENPVDPATPPVLIEDAKWRNVRIGDFVILRTGDPAPADILILATSADDNSCYVETKNLDGETNLKPRTAVAETAGVRDPAGCARLRAIVEADPPSSNMTKFNGSVRIFSAPAVPGADDSPAPSSAVGSAPPLSFPPQSPLSPRGPPPPGPRAPPPPGPRAPPHRSTGSSDSYEMRLLGQHRQQPFRQSPLAQSAAQKHLDDSEDAPPSYDLDTAVPTSNDW